MNTIRVMKMMMLCMFFTTTMTAQIGDTILNTSQRMALSDKKLSIGAYGQVDYNQPIEDGKVRNGKLDVHRMILMVNNKFSNKTSFFTEIEFEHVVEVYIEQAFLRHKFNKYFNLNAGLLLVPMGIINEYHESPTFNGVERPNVDKAIVPTTWREIGFGLTGRLDEAAIKYQLYMMNGFKSFDGAGLLRGSDGLRKGRQKGAESIINTPSLSAKVDYYGLPGLKLGLSGYVGKTQSSLFSNLDESDAFLQSQADSSIVGVTMVGLDARYSKKGFQARGQFIYASLSNTGEYNEFAQKDVGAAMYGTYVEVAYNVLRKTKYKTQLIPFVRYENYNTHADTEGITQNDNYNKDEWIFGLGWKLTSGAMLKVDYQRINIKDSDTHNDQINAGVAIWF